MPARSWSLTRLYCLLSGAPPPAELGERYQANSFMLAALLGLVACVCLSSIFWLLGAPREAAVMWMGGGGVVAVLLVHRRTRKVGRSLHCLLAVYFALTCYYSYVLGGLRSAAVWWFIVPPAVVVTCGMRRGTLQWCMACALALLALYALESGGHDLPETPGADSLTLYLYSLMLLASLLLCFMALLGRTRERSMERLEQTVAELRDARDAALAAAQAKAEFLANMSHEVRTPVTGVLGMANLLAQTALAEQQVRYLATLRHSGEQLLRLVDDVLDYQGLEAQQVVLDDAPFEPRAIVTGLVDSLAASAAAKRLALVATVADEVPLQVLGDARRVRQILFNLLDNALKFTRLGRVSIAVRPAAAADEEATHLVFDVSDTGIGMDETTVRRLFAAFSQADTSSTRVFGGLGLGLAISQSLARLMHGQLTVESRPGIGTTIRCTLRFGRATLAVAEQTAAPPDMPSVLLVEDNPANLQLGVAMLEQLDCAVTVARDGAEACACWRAGRFDLVLMDCQMPVMDGFEATREIRASERAMRIPATPIVAVTANVLKADREACFEAGMDDFLAKPYTLAQLQDLIVRHAPRARAA